MSGPENAELTLPFREIDRAALPVAGGKAANLSHGAVVAREYGIPAVVGVPEATERITTGERIAVDGSAGTIVVER